MCKKVAEHMATLLPEMEKKMFKAHNDFLGIQVQHMKTITEIHGKISEAEEAGNYCILRTLDYVPFALYY